MRRFSFLLLAFAFVASSGAMIGLQANRASALSGSSFRAGRIIDDVIFYNKNSMSAAQIQQFLNAKLPVCDRWRASSNPSYQPPYTCLNEYQENTTTKENNYGRFDGAGNPLQIAGGKSAAQIIWDVGQQYGINPQVLIVMLQKEQSLITDNWPWKLQYDRAMGYACPDSGPGGTANCNAAYYGFYNQVDSAAWQLKRYIERPNEYNFKVGVSRYIQFSPNTACGGTNVFLENAATAALYNYTPYQPNAAALANLYGTGDGCSAYGNRNFWRMFNDWFGSTLAPDYAWSIASTASYADNTKSIGSPTGTMVAGQRAYIVMQIRNQGNMTWDNTSGNLRLGASGPIDRMSGFCDSWLSCNRVARANETTIAPGEVATFEFYYRAPEITGTFVERFSPLIEGAGWLADNGLFLQTTVLPRQYTWQFISQGAYRDSGFTQPADLTKMSPGEKYWLRLVAKNTGNSNWYNNPANGQLVNLGASAPTDRSSALYDPSWLGYSRPTALKEAVVGPGQLGTFEFVVNAPNMSFTSLERFNLVAEGRTWMPDNGVGFFTKLSNNYSWAFVAQYAYTDATKTVPANLANLNPGQTVYIGYIARNTGPTTWYRDSAYSINTATSSPTDRLSTFSAPEWISASRPTKLIESSVSPGQLGTFEFTYKAPAATGEYREYFRPVAENIMHMNDIGMFFYTIVR